MEKNQTTPDIAAEVAKLKEENRNLKRIIDALMYGYNTLCEADLETGHVEFYKFGNPDFSRWGLQGELPPYDTMIEAYIQNGVEEEDREKVRQAFDKQHLLSQMAIGQSLSTECRNEKGIYGEIKIVKVGETTILAGFTEKDREISERYEQLYTDSLTGAKNRKYYDDYLSSKICSALAMADIDSFKTINDSQGHLCGDEVLALVASTLRSSVRENDEVVRYGGDEFIIVFQNVSRVKIESRMEEIRKTVENLRLESYPDVGLSMSFGVVYGTGVVKDMLSAADQLLYASKKHRNTVTIRPVEY